MCVRKAAGCGRTRCVASWCCGFLCTQRTWASTLWELVKGVHGTNFFMEKSPNDLATASTPSTRLRSTKPPASSMRFTSGASSAL